MKKAAILASEPIVKINGIPLLELILSNLHFHDFSQVKIIFNDEGRKLNLKQLPSLTQRNIDYFFKTTVSPLQALFEVCKKLQLNRNEHFFVSIVDSIVKPLEAKSFINFCSMLEEDESAVIATPVTEAAKATTLKVSHCGYAREFQCAPDEDVLATTGIYCFSESIRIVLKEMIDAGETEIKNFLSELLKRHYRVRVFNGERNEHAKKMDAF